MTGRRMSARVVVAILVVVALAVAVQVIRPGSEGTRVAAYFTSSNGIYAGDEVRILGVPVGTVDKISPEGRAVRIEFHFDSDIKVPADAKAAIVAPSLVSSRYIQLAPRFDGGEQMKDGAVIPLARTATPVEWDEIKEQINDLAIALGPQGANKDGSLSRLVDSGAAALEGEGDNINTTIASLSAAVRTLDTGSDDAFTTVRNLQKFVSALAASDRQIAQFTTRLDLVSALLTDDKRAIATALKQLGVTVKKVERFVRANRGRVTKTLAGLTDVTSVVARQQGDLAQILHVAPNALQNLTESYHQRQNAVAVDLHGANINSPGQLVCGALAGVAGDEGQAAGDLCASLIGDLLDQLAANPQSQELLELIRQILGEA